MTRKRKSRVIWFLSWASWERDEKNSEEWERRILCTQGTLDLTPKNAIKQWQNLNKEIYRVAYWHHVGFGVFFLEQYISFARCKTKEHNKFLAQTHILSLIMAVGNTIQASKLTLFGNSQKICLFPLSLVAEKVRWEPWSTCSSGAQGRSLLKLLDSTRKAAVGLGHMISTQSPNSFTGKTVRAYGQAVCERDWGTVKCCDVPLCRAPEESPVSSV